MTRTIPTRAVPLAALLITFALVVPSLAAANDDRGFTLGLQYQTSMIGAEDPPADTGPNALYFDEVGHGISLVLGYRFTPSFELRLTGSTARHETTQDGVEAHYGNGVLEAHYQFVPEQQARPYLYGGLGGATIRVDTQGFESEIKGGLAVVGGGFAYSLSPHLVLDFSARLDLINWDETRVTFRGTDGSELTLEAPVDDSGSAAKLLLGLVWEF